MKLTILLLCAAMLAGSTCATSARESMTSLFNGKDLSGWVHVGPNPESFRVQDGTIMVTGAGNQPNWLRSEKEYENFVLRFEYMTPGWCEAGVLLHAPPYGRPSKSGLKIHLRHDQVDEGARASGSIYDVLPPLVQAGRPAKEWNQMEVHLNWPRLRVTLNGQTIHDVDMHWNEKLRTRIRRGYIGFQDIGTPIHYRNIEIRELPATESWAAMFNGRNLDGWTISGPARWSVENGMIVGFDGDGYLISDIDYSDFEFQVYVKTSKRANGGIFTRWQSEKLRGYETQIYNVNEATNPTGSIYGLVPAVDPDSRDGEWFLMQIISRGSYQGIFINGQCVAESNRLRIPDRGRIVLQMHAKGARIEFMNPRMKSSFQ